MRFLIDMPVSPRVTAWQAEQGHDAVHAMHAGLGRASDRELLDRAVQDSRIVITADTDFPQLMALSQASSPGVILFRGGNYSAVEMVDLLKRVLDAALPEDLAVSISVVDRQHVRYRRLPMR